ncbi:hypothetical protein [Streptomyces hoynatensis]|uniref:Uncharacterized protein n=1 Tax=Streptomyces hoynatensis TaxID=1141874 RepID=A0A3A9ZEU2_9ACTN|nr:hypothetical protein [Streptomyces hoynatensis]RKN45747.1 hypothetical protein D7294_04615 [Streptomyces hoynatensis]
MTATGTPVPAGRVLTWGPKRLPVPYAAPWSGEEVQTGSGLVLRPDGNGIGYRDETPADRDRHGVLWARMTDSPGSGRPNYRTMHIQRQRACMLGLLCQVCGGPADRDAKGWLFVLRQPPPHEDTPGWPEGLLCTKPPVCRPCAHLAAHHCPHLERPVRIRSRKPRVWGVFGGAFDAGLRPGPDAHLPYGHPATPWFLANQAVLELTRCTRESPPAA